MAFKLDEQLQRIADKDALHKWIDAQPDEARMMIMVDPGGDSHFLWRRLGNFLRNEVCWMVECLKWQMLEDEAADDE